MSDAVATHVLHDGPRNYVVRLSSVSDGTGESAALKINPALLHEAPVDLVLDKISWTTAGMGVQLHWDGDEPALLWSIPADDTNEIDFCRMGGLRNPRRTGWTGKITLTTVGHTNNDAYNVVLQFHKKYGQAALAITSAATAEVAENVELAFALTANRDVTWTIEGGADAAQFALAGNILTWVADGTQDYESPADANTDNAYVVIVRATDGAGATDDLTMTITVTDVAE